VSCALPRQGMHTAACMPVATALNTPVVATESLRTPGKQAKDEMPAVSPSESDIRKAQVHPGRPHYCHRCGVAREHGCDTACVARQGRLAGCYAECAVEYERQLPKFGQDVRSQLRRALKQ
jgi:hypothetical protein